MLSNDGEEEKLLNLDQTTKRCMLFQKWLQENKDSISRVGCLYGNRILLAAGRFNLDGDLLWAWCLGHNVRLDLLRDDGHCRDLFGRDFHRPTCTTVAEAGGVGDGLKTTVHRPRGGSCGVNNFLHSVGLAVERCQQ
jgi:hypothetical protein